MEEKKQIKFTGTIHLGLITLVILFVSIWALISNAITSKEFFIVTIPLTTASFVAKRHEIYWKQAFAGLSAISLLSGALAVLSEYNLDASGAEVVIATATSVCYGIYLYKTEGEKSVRGFATLSVAVAIFYLLLLK